MALKGVAWAHQKRGRQPVIAPMVKVSFKTVITAFRLIIMAVRKQQRKDTQDIQTLYKYSSDLVIPKG